MLSLGGVMIDLSPGDADRGPTEVVKMDLHRARRDAKALLRAVRAGDPEARARLHAQGVPQRGRVLLADAQLAVARELGAPSWPALTADNGRARRLALGRASAAGDHAQVRRLLNAGTDVGPSRALTCALARDDAGLVALLLAFRDQDLSPDDWPEFRDALVAAIHRCCSADVIDALREGGAPSDPTDEYGRSAALLAWRWGRDDFDHPGPVTAADRFSRACWRGDEATARALGNEGVLEDEALIWAARAGNLAAVELLIDLGGAPINRRGHGGMPALEYARRQGHTAVERALLARGANPDIHKPPFVQAVTRHGLDTRLHAAWIRHLATTIPNADVWAVGDGLGLRTGVDNNTWNGVVASQASSAEVAATLDRLNDAPAIWTIPDGGTLGRELVAAGADQETTAIIVQGERTQLMLDRPKPPGLTFARADAESWAALGDEGLQADTTLAGDALRLVAARQDERVVGVAALLVDADAALLVDLLVCAGHRHCGIGSALVAHLLTDAPDVQVLLAEPTPDSQPFWRLLGLRPASATPRTTYYLPVRGNSNDPR